MLAENVWVYATKHKPDITKKQFTYEFIFERVGEKHSSAKLWIWQCSFGVVQFNKKNHLTQARILYSKAWWVNMPERSIWLVTWSLETTPESPNFYNDSENTIIFQSHEECYSIRTLHLLALPSQKQCIWGSNYESPQTSTIIKTGTTWIGAIDVVPRKVGTDADFHGI